MKKEMKEYWYATKWAIGIVLTAVLLVLLVSCKTEYIPVESTHTEHHWHTDSVKQVDSVYHEVQTTIMQLDSAEMAKYGIQLKTAERAWIVKNKELEKQIAILQRLAAERDTVEKEIAVPYPVEKKLTKWQQVKIDFGELIILVSIIIVIVFLVRNPRRNQHKGS